MNDYSDRIGEPVRGIIIGANIECIGYYREQKDDGYLIFSPARKVYLFMQRN
jgi:hypothetical protein